MIKKDGYTYIARPITEGFIFERTEDGGIMTNLPWRVTHHSPDGFEWGYGGSGPADTALNICEAVLAEIGYTGPTMKLDPGRPSDETNLVFVATFDMYQTVKFLHVASLDQRGGVIMYHPVQSTVVNWLRDKQERIDERSVQLGPHKP